MTTVAQRADAYRFIIDLVYNSCGIKLHDGKEQLIDARLGRRLRHHGCATLAEYCEVLRSCPDDEEITLLVDALTTNFTHFFREADHFEFMTSHALPMALRSDSRKKFSVWSAACSSGEEPYTIAMHLAERFPPAQGWDWQITGSDISTKVLTTAQQAIYPAERMDKLPPGWLPKYFQKGVGDWQGHFRVRPALTERVRFRRINLIDDYRHDRKFDLIFCRNVMIYFDRKTQEELVNRLCRFLIPQGHLLIGHAESLNGLDVPVRCVRPSVYQLC